MSLFQCFECGCRENTATCNFWSRLDGQWRGVTAQPWMLCSACDPAIGEWHDRFERVFLPLGLFVTNERGNLAHRETGEEGTQGYACRPPREVAERAVNKFLQRALSCPEVMPGFELLEDGELGWAFWILTEDTTSYVHSDLKVEWYGTGWDEGMEADADQ